MCMKLMKMAPRWGAGQPLVAGQGHQSSAIDLESVGQSLQASSQAISQLEKLRALKSSQARRGEVDLDDVTPLGNGSTRGSYLEVDGAADTSGLYIATVDALVLERGKKEAELESANASHSQHDFNHDLV